MKFKVLQVQGGMNRGGTEAVIMNWYKTIDLEKIQFDFTTFSTVELPYDKEIVEKGGEVLYVPSRNKVGIIKHCYYLYKCIKDNGPYDVVHSHNNFHGGIVALIAKLAGVKNVISHAHNTKDDGVGIKRKIEIYILRKLIHRFSDKLLACGTEAGNFVYGNKAKFEVINNSVDMQKFKPADENMKQMIKHIKNEYDINDKLIIGHIGRFSKQKNHLFIVSLIEKMKNQELDFKILLIGDGELKEGILNELSNWGLNKYVIYLGLQDDVSLWLNIMDVFILPSLYEGLPVVLVEAQSTGTPCIVSEFVSKEADLGLGLTDFIGINSNNEEEWINLILKRVGNKVKNEKIISKVMEEKGYSLDSSTRRIHSIYVQSKNKREKGTI